MKLQQVLQFGSTKLNTRTILILWSSSPQIASTPIPNYLVVRGNFCFQNSVSTFFLPQYNQINIFLVWNAACSTMGKNLIGLELFGTCKMCRINNLQFLMVVTLPLDDNILNLSHLFTTQLGSLEVRDFWHLNVNNLSGKKLVFCTEPKSNDRISCNIEYNQYF